MVHQEVKFLYYFIGVFEIIRESQLQYPVICRKALESLADILGGLQPEELSNEPNTIIDPMFETLLELATIDSSDDDIRSLASCCLLRYAFFFSEIKFTFFVFFPRNTYHDFISAFLWLMEILEKHFWRRPQC